MTPLAERGWIITQVQEAINAGARQARACKVIGLTERTMQRWQVDQLKCYQRTSRPQNPTNKLTVLERQKVLTVANSDEFGSMSPNQIVLILADRGEYIASESIFYRIMKAGAAEAPGC